MSPLGCFCTWSLCAPYGQRVNLSTSPFYEPLRRSDLFRSCGDQQVPGHNRPRIRVSLEASSSADYQYPSRACVRPPSPLPPRQTPGPRRSCALSGQTRKAHSLAGGSLLSNTPQDPRGPNTSMTLDPSGQVGPVSIIERHLAAGAFVELPDESLPGDISSWE